MRFNTVTIVAILAAVAQAQSITDLVGQIPTCAVSCLTSAISSAGCGIADYMCQCTTGHDQILANGAGCIQGACSTSDALKTTDVTNKICALATAGGSSAASAANSATSAVASAASSAANAVSSSIASVVSSAASAASASATAAASASASASAAASSAATKASASPSASTTPNSGNTLKVGASILGAAIVAALAL